MARVIEQTREQRNAIEALAEEYGEVAVTMTRTRTDGVLALVQGVGGKLVAINENGRQR